MLHDRFTVPRACLRLATLAATLMLAVGARAESSGRVDFAALDLPPAAVEVDAGAELITDVLGIGDAALAGVSETLSQAADEDPAAPELKMAAGHLEAARQIVHLAGEVVQEVRVRVYQDGPQELLGKCDSLLTGSNWTRVVRARDGDNFVSVSIAREAGALVGLFVVAGDGGDMVLVNVVCNASPENIKQLTAAATKIGLDNGLRQVIQQKMQHMRH